MNTIRRSVALVGIALLAIVTFLAGGPAAFAQRPAPDPGGATVPTPPVGPDPAQITVQHGTPFWVFVVVAAVAIAFTLAAEVVFVSARPSLRRRLRHA